MEEREIMRNLAEEVWFPENPAIGGLPIVRERKRPHGEASTYHSSIWDSKKLICRVEFGYDDSKDNEAVMKLFAVSPELLKIAKRVLFIRCFGPTGNKDVDLLAEEVGKLIGRTGL